MKKKKLGILASAIATVAVCICMIAGATFALFTSNDSVNIAITSGKVDATASVAKVVTYSKDVEQEVKTADGETRYMFENGGYATVDENSVALYAITPMDKAEITVSIENKSTVNVLYRTYFKVSGDNGLAEALVCEIDGAVYTGEMGWYEFTEDKEVTFTIELPEETGNEYQDKSCTVSYMVELVQANAAVVKAEDATAKTYAVDGKLVSLQSAFNVAQPGDTLELIDDLHITKTASYAAVKGNDLPIIIEGNGHTVYGNTTDQVNGNVISSSHKAAIRNLNMECVTALEHGSGIWLSGTGNELTNVRIEGSFNMAAVNLSNVNASATITDCYFRNYERTEEVNGNKTFVMVYGGKAYNEYTFNQVCGFHLVGLFVSGSSTSPKTTLNNCDIEVITINRVGTANHRLDVNENNKIGTIYNCTVESKLTLTVNENGNNEIGEILYCPDNSGDFAIDGMLADGSLEEVTEVPTREGYVFAGWYCNAKKTTYTTYEELANAIAAKELGEGNSLVCLWTKAE